MRSYRLCCINDFCRRRQDYILSIMLLYLRTLHDWAGIDRFSLSCMHCTERDNGTYTGGSQLLCTGELTNRQWL